MLEKLNEPIDVQVNFLGNKVIPMSFVWQKRTYDIQKVNLVHRVKNGEHYIYYFSVSDEANFFRLAFFLKDLSWRIEEIFYEG